LAVDHARVSSLFARPRLTRRLRIGIVINPTGDLPGASVEGESLIRNLSALSSDVHRSSLNGTEATLDAVCELLTQVDVLHFCGHAAFDAHNPAAAGLQLTDGQVLTASHLSEVHSLPRVVVLNACQAARVRGDSANLPSGAYSLAAMLLRSGVEAFVGTFWQVDDAAAADFSASVYQSLTAGETLRASVTRARRLLAERKHADWGNYILYGDGRFQLM